VFLGCTGYSLKGDDQCTETINLTPGDDVESYAGDDEDEGNIQEIQNKKRCLLCETAMDSYLVTETMRLHVCGNNPECAGFIKEEGKFRIKGYDGPTIQCDKCQEVMQLKTGRFGKYFGCMNEGCKNTRKLLKSGEAAPPKAKAIPMPELPCEKGPGHFILRDGAGGLFLASSEFPRSRETKKPLVADLIRHKKDLDPKFLFLIEAPEKDPKGGWTVVRFSRKTRSYFIGSDDMPSWSLVYEKGKWISP
jgi:DNA topoisomerase-1